MEHFKEASVNEIDEINKRILEIRFPMSKCDPSRCPVCGWPYRKDGCQPDNCSMRPVPAVRACEDTRDYGRDIAAALELVDGVDTTLHHHVWGDGLWYAAIRPDPNGKSIYACAPTAPEAIALAWLAWHEAMTATVTPCPTCGGAMHREGSGWACSNCEGEG
jgi:hypothetical protein